MLGLGALAVLILCVWLFLQSNNASKRIEASINQFITQELVFLDFTPFVCDGFSEIVCKSERVSYNPPFAIIGDDIDLTKTIAQNIQITLSGSTKSANIGLNTNLTQSNIPLSCNAELSLIDKDIYAPSGEELLIQITPSPKAMRLLNTQLQCKSQNADFLQNTHIAFDITHKAFANSGLQEILSLLKNTQSLGDIYFRLNLVNVDLHSRNLKEYITKIFFDSVQNSDIERTIFALQFMQKTLLGEFNKNPQSSATNKEFAKSLTKALLIMRDIVEDKVHSASFSLQSQSDATPFVPLDKYALSLIVAQNYLLHASGEGDSPSTQSLESAEFAPIQPSATMQP